MVSRRAAVTSSVLYEHKRMIDEATSDLQEHLYDIFQDLQMLNEATEGPSNSKSDIKGIQEEKQSTEQCLLSGA